MALSELDALGYCSRCVNLRLLITGHKGTVYPLFIVHMPFWSHFGRVFGRLTLTEWSTELQAPLGSFVINFREEH